MLRTDDVIGVFCQEMSFKERQQIMETDDNSLHSPDKVKITLIIKFH